jgi:site-specific recombinase XerD
VLTTTPFSQVEIRIRIPARLPRCLTHGETEALVRAAEEADSTTRLALHLLLATGIRVGELAGVRIGDVDTDQQTMRILGKGSRERQVFLPDRSLATAVASYLGPVDKPDPDATATEQDKSQEAAAGFVISSGDPPLLFEMADEAFDA